MRSKTFEFSQSILRAKLEGLFVKMLNSSYHPYLTSRLLVIINGSMDETITPIPGSQSLECVTPANQPLLRYIRQKNGHTVLVNVFEHLECIVSGLRERSNVHGFVTA